MVKKGELAFHAVCAWVVRGRGEDARYLMLRRCADYLAGNWQMVLGRMEKHEPARRAALREIREETGLTPAALYNSGETEIFYEACSDRMVVVPAFVAFVDELAVTLSPDEHDAYEWLAFKEALERLEFPQQRRVLKAIHENFVLAEPEVRLLIDTGDVDA